MQTIIVASQNPVKIQAVEEGFRAMFPHLNFIVKGVAVLSGVSHQPLTDTETELGALSRVKHAKKDFPASDFWVGIEGGVEDGKKYMESFAWVIIEAKDTKVGKGKTGTFVLPQKVADLIRNGKELGEADDIVFKRRNSKQQSGAVGILTGDIIDRMMYYRDAVILALIPFKNRGYY